ncbi:hypothetical protein FSY45_24790 [Comamonas sp. Z1]|uniref:hypothetical protein n=1 Tax=Comamonas TaxID=283 RepID=UPI0011E7483A|nr:MULTISPECIES: hypothetical protein [Comamonas]TYK70284.1 hypothetical protein FSY45_24790 [Comamonas sp. Z1]UBQ44587.1 hypothetical protein LCH15_26220 [Comamonas thiooxydans]
MTAVLSPLPAPASPEPVDGRTIFMELRTGQKLQLPGGISLELQFKKGQTARFMVKTPAGADVKKIQQGAAEPAPSRAF